MTIQNWVKQGEQASKHAASYREHVMKLAEEHGFKVEVIQDQLTIRIPHTLDIKERTKIIEALQSQKSLD